MLFQRASGVYEEATQRRSSILSNSSELSYIEGVRIEDFIELLLVALQSIAQHTAARLTIIHSPEGVFASFVQVDIIYLNFYVVGIAELNFPPLCSTSTTVRNTFNGRLWIFSMS